MKRLSISKARTAARGEPLTGHFWSLTTSESKDSYDVILFLPRRHSAATKVDPSWRKYILDFLFYKGHNE